MWYNDSTVKRIIQETAEECGVTPDNVLGVLNSIFDTIIAGISKPNIGMFRLRGLGSLQKKGYITKRTRTIEDRRKRGIKNAQEETELEDEDYEDEEIEIAED